MIIAGLVFNFLAIVLFLARHDADLINYLNLFFLALASAMFGEETK